MSPHSMTRPCTLTVAIASLLLGSTLALAQSPRAAPAPPAWAAAVDAALGRHGTMNPGDVYKFSLPRTDLHVSIGGVQVRPALALGSWIAFRPVRDTTALVMGDLVLEESETGPVMQALQRGGVQQTALHNHLLGESPRVLYMHIMAMGNAARIAAVIHDALAASATPLAASGAPTAAAGSAVELDTLAIARTLGHAGKVNGGVYQVSVPRAEPIRDGGTVIPPAMGTATALNFQATGQGRAVSTGDFVLLAREVNPVIRALRGHGIQVTAIHSHMLTEEPRLFFMHFWANDDAIAIARGLRAALDETAGQRR